MMRIISIIWRGWLKFAEKLGNIQLAILLSLIYWTMILLVAIPSKLLSDPLALRNTNRPKWIRRSPVSDVWEHLRKQG